MSELNAHLEAEFGITLAMRVGIDTGEVVVSMDRPDQKVSVVGETVNLASRLQGEAPEDGVLISGDTYRHVRGGFSFRALGPLTLRGVGRPVEGHVVIRERPHRFELDEGRGVEGVDTRTIGREVELLGLQQHFEDMVDDGSPRAVTIVGDAGVGKSRLLRELDRWLAEIPDQVWWFRGRASSSSQNLPNSLVRDMMAARLDIHESDGPEAVRLKWEDGMARHFDEGVEARAHLVAHWLGFDVGDSAHIRGVRHDSQGLHDRARTYLADFLKKLAGESPVVVLLEDLHWADEGSLRWFDDAGLLLEGSPVLVVATARPSLFERYPAWGENGDFHTRIPLDSLSPRQSRRLVGEILQKAEHIPASLVELIVEATDGNPFYIEELVKWMLEAGVIEKDGDRWTVLEQKIDRARVPATLRGVLQARLDALAPDERQALQQAAVIGRVFWDEAVETLSAATGAGQVPVGTSLDRLRSREVVFERRQSTFDDTREFLFKHALLRDVTYDSVLKGRRVGYHAQAARWLEQVAERNRRTDQYAGLIAGHHDLAADAVTGARWYLRAGRQAASVHALTEATRLLGRGIEILPEDEWELRFDLLMARETVLDQIGDRASQQEDLAAMDALLPRLDPLRRTNLLICKATWSFNHSDYVTQVVFAQEAVEVASEHGLTDAEGEARLAWGKGLAWSGQHLAAREVLEKALALARQVGRPRLIGETLRYMSIVANNQSDFARSMDLLGQALEIGRASNDTEAESLVLVQMGTVLYNQGHYAKARVQLERALPIYIESGHRYRQAVAMSNIAGIAVIQGDLGVARKLVTKGLELTLHLGDKEGIATAHTILGDVYRRAGLYQLAREQLEESVRVSDEIGFDFVASDALLSLALIADVQGKPSEAAEFNAKAAQRGEKADSPLAIARARLGEGLVLADTGDLDGAEGALTEARRQGEEMSIGYMVTETDAALAAIALLRGDLDGAGEIVAGLSGRIERIRLEGCLEPARVYLACIKVLDRVDPPGAAAVRTTASEYLDGVTSSIGDEDSDLRDGFMATRSNTELLSAIQAGGEE